jgi:hypothetical protein
VIVSRPAERVIDQFLLQGGDPMRYNFEIYVGTVPYDQCWSNLWMDPDGNTFECISDFMYHPKIKDDTCYHGLTMIEIEKSLVPDDPIPF